MTSIRTSGHFDAPGHAEPNIGVRARRRVVQIQRQHELRSGIYMPLAYRRMRITEPKPRYIEAPHYRDRIVQHTLFHSLSAQFERYFIRDSYACRKSKGVHAAAARVQRFLRSTGTETHVLQIDISKYYASINHGRLIELLARRVRDPRVMRLLITIIESTDSGDEHDHLFASHASTDSLIQAAREDFENHRLLAQVHEVLRARQDLMGPVQLQFPFWEDSDEPNHRASGQLDRYTR